MLALRAGSVRVGIDPEAGGRLASLAVDGRELLVGPARPDDRSIRWGCYLMAPWPGRLAGARLPWRGRTIQLPRTHGRHAIHGLVWGIPWQVEEASERDATLSCRLPAAWPMGGIVRQSFVLAQDRLTMVATVSAGEAMPAAIGWHPWFARRALPVAVRLDADSVMETRGLIPTGATLPAVDRLDLRAGPALGSRRLDHVYPMATSPASITWPDLSLELAFEPSPATVVVHTPARGVCVEPETAPPNALALPPEAAQAAGVRLLAAGETMSARFELAWR